MKRFHAILEDVNHRLPLPLPTRSRILLEMAADLEDLFQHYVAEGLDEAEAQRRAESTVAASDDVLERLVAVHRPGLDRFGEQIAGQVAGVWQRTLLGTLLLFALLAIGGTVFDSGFVAHASVFVWPVVALGAAALVLVLAKLYDLLIRRQSDLRRLRSGLGSVLFLAATTLVAGVDGFLIELFVYLRRYGLGQPNAGLGDWLVTVASMMIVTLVTAMLAALAWFLLTRWVARIENREAAALLQAG